MILERYWKLFRELFLYGMIGAFSASMDTISFLLLGKAGLSLLPANFISVNIGIGLSFFLNTYFNFKKADRISRRAIRFFSIGYIGLLLSMGIMWAGMHIAGMDKLIVKIISVIAAAVLQYVLNKFVTFKD